MTLKFLLKKQRSGNATLTARFYHNGVAKDHPTGFTIDNPDDWTKDEKKEWDNGRLKGHTQANNLMNDWRNKFTQYETFCEQNAEQPDVYKAIGFVCGQKKMKLTGFTIIDACDTYIADKEATHDVGTIKKYEVLKNFILGYEKYIQQNPDKKYSSIKLDNLSPTLLENIASYDITQNESQNSTVKRRLTAVLTVLQHAKTKKMMAEIPAQIQPTLKTPDSNRFSLTENELNILKNYKPTSPTDKLKVDIFLFSCETGLRFEDLINIKPRNVVLVDGEESLSFHMDKGSVKSIIIPLSNFALKIIDYYKKNDNIPLFVDMPGNANHLNSRLKDIFKLAELTRTVEINEKSGNKSKIIPKKIHQVAHIHMARHTFATLMIQRGMMLTELKELMGHSKIETTMKYVHTDKQKAVSNGREILNSVRITKLKAV